MVRNGLRGRSQLYKCKDCGKQFLGGRRRDKSQVITDYIEGKQTRNQLAVKYGVSSKTIARDLEKMRYVQKISKYKQVVIQMDGHHLLGPELRSYGYQGLPEEEDIMAQVCRP